MYNYPLDLSDIDFDLISDEKLVNWFEQDHPLEVDKEKEEKSIPRGIFKMEW